MSQVYELLGHIFDHEDAQRLRAESLLQCRKRNIA